MKKKIIIGAVIGVTILTAISLSQARPYQPPIQPEITPTPTPTASPSATPTPKPLTFSEMNALYGPCVSLPILMYHHIQDAETARQNGTASLTVNPDIFEKQLAFLQSRGYQSIGPAELISFFNSGQALPNKAVMLTFDDGYEDFGRVAAPLLSQYGFKSILFVATGLLDNANYLSWEAVRNLGGNVYVGNHTWSHQNMGANLETIKREVTTAAGQLTEKGLDPLKVFAYPYGIVSQKAVGFLAESGYQLAFTTNPGRVLCQKQRLALPRIRIGNTSISAYGL